jgi:hypothetical protein
MSHFWAEMSTTAQKYFRNIDKTPDFIGLRERFFSADVLIRLPEDVSLRPFRPLPALPGSGSGDVRPALRGKLLRPRLAALQSAQPAKSYSGRVLFGRWIRGLCDDRGSQHIEVLALA